jgi:cytoskeletal protein RodZ
MAIESDEYWKLPSVVYGLAYVRSYARFVGLDPDLIAAQFKAELADMPQIHGLSRQANEVDFSSSYLPSPGGGALWAPLLERAGLYASATIALGAVAAYFAWRVIAGV